MTSVQISKLKNGLTIATDFVPSAHSVSMGIWIKAGSRDEGAEKNGTAHFLEHMVFKGTQNFSAQQIAERIESVGGSLNAYTSRESTAFYARVLPEDQELALTLLAELTQSANLTPEDFERERQVILQEFHQINDSPDELIFDLFQKTAYEDEEIGMPVLGQLETLLLLSPEDIEEFYKRTYIAPNMVLSCAGRVDHEKIVALAEKLFSSLPSGQSRQRPQTHYKGGLHLEDRDLEQTHILLGFPGVPLGHDQHMTQSVLATILGGGMSSRLFQELREKRALAYHISAFSLPFSDSGLLAIYTGTTPDQVSLLLPLITEEILKTAETLTQEEIQRAQAQIRASLLISNESLSHRSEQLASSLLSYGRPIPTEEWVNAVNSVTETQIQNFIFNHLIGTEKSQRPTFTTIGSLHDLPDLSRYETLFRRSVQ